MPPKSDHSTKAIETNTATVTQNREPGWLQITLILFTVCLSVLVTAVLGPSLPKMQAYYSSVELAPQLVPLAMTVPMLMMAIFSIPAGKLSDRFGRKRPLVIGCFAYAVLGTAPLYLGSLQAIVASRIALGIVEALVVVIGITLIGDFFEGRKRERILALQTTTAAVSAVVLNNVGGVLGDVSWRAPYFVYLIGFVLAVMMIFYLWEPEKPVRSTLDKSISHENEPTPSLGISSGMLVFMGFIVVFGGLVFLTIPVNLGFLFDAIGVKSVAQIGAAYGLNSLSVAIGSFLFGWGLSGRVKTSSQYAIASCLLAIGFFGMSSAESYASLTIYSVVASLGAGILLPTLVVWATSLFPLQKRGVGSGVYNSCINFGNFLSGIIVVLLATWLGSRADAMMLFAIILSVLCVSALVIQKLHPTRN